MIPIKYYGSILELITAQSSPLGHNHDLLYSPLGHSHGPGSSAWGDLTGTLSDQTDLQTALDGKSATSHNHDATYALAAHNHSGDYAALVHTHVATAISDSTAVGRSVLTAANAAAARTAIGAGTSSFDGVYSSLTSIPATFAPAAHDAGLVTSGQFAMARLASGAPDGTKFIRDDGTLQTVTASLPDLVTTKLSVTADQTVAAGYGAYIPDLYEIGATFALEVGAGSVLEIG